MVRVDLDGNAADPEAAAPSTERVLHCAIYRARPDVEAVVHAHAAYATILGMAGIPFTPVTTEAAFFGDIPRVPFLMPGSEALATAARDALGDGSAVLLQNHGLVVAASSQRQAANAAEVIERVSHLIWSCHVAGREAPILPEDVLGTLREIGRMMA
jgi:ribulose-5-phosphate 4-epimerase/fuculose-1-phosphate aldolase